MRRLVLLLCVVATMPLVGATAEAAPTCATSDLRLSAAYLNGAGGQEWTGVTLHSRIDHACVLDGYPGVSYLNRQHRQVGAAATRDQFQKPQRVVLRPNGVAGFVVTNHPAACNGGRAPTPPLIRVYPPGQYRARVINNARNGGSRPVPVCQPTVGAVRPGHPRPPE